MYKLSIQYDPENMKCDFDGNRIESNEEIYADDINQLYCAHADGYEYIGLATVSDPNTVVDDLYGYFKYHKDDKNNTLVLIPVFKELVDDGRSGMSITIVHKHTNYSFHIDEPTPVRYFAEKIFPSDQYDNEKIILVNQSTNKSYTINDEITEEGVYTVDYLEPLITFNVDGKIIKFKEDLSATSITLPLSAVSNPPEIIVADHYVFNMWTSTDGNWDTIHTVLNSPATFTASAYLKKWNVIFTGCGKDTSMIVTDGDYVIAPNCSKDGYDFKEWKEGFSTISSSNIIVYLLVIVFIISVIVLFVPSVHSYITRGIQSKTSY